MSRMDLEQRLRYTFQQVALLDEALTHSSYAHETRISVSHNERLEFLGDAVLQLAVSHLLYLQYPVEPEGTLSLYRQHLVCEDTLSRAAEFLSLGAELRLGHGVEKDGGRTKKRLLADALEALLGAIYLDAGDRGEQVVFSIVQDLFKEELVCCTAIRGDYKSRLQTLVEQDGCERLEYRVVSEDGPAHAPRFTVVAYLNSNAVGTGIGHSKLEAEMHAAKEALRLFGET